MKEQEDKFILFLSKRESEAGKVFVLQKKDAICLLLRYNIEC